MTPTDTIGDDVKLYRGDALQVLPTLAAVDAVVTDPPFGVRSEDWDDMEPQEFARFTMAWLSQVRLIAKELVVFGTGYGPLRTLCEMLWPRVRVMVWNKPLGSQYAGAAERGLWFSHEIILHCHAGFDPSKGEQIARMIRTAREAKGLSRSALDMKARGKKTGLCYRWEEASCVPTVEQAERLSDVLGLSGEFSALVRECSRPSAAGGRDVFDCRTVAEGVHPCEKPIRLLTEIMEALGSKWATVLDPFMGSGSTGDACMRVGKVFVGIESDPTHYATAMRRLTHATGAGPGQLFAGLEAAS